MGEARENVNFYWKNFEFANERISINLWNLTEASSFMVYTFLSDSVFSVRFIQLLWGRGGDLYKLK